MMDPAEKVAREAEVVRLRTAHLEWAEIGRRINRTGARAYQIYQEALTRVPMQAVDEHRAALLETQDLAIRQLIGIALDPSTETQIKVNAWTAVKGYLAERAKVVGAYAPTKHEFTPLTQLDEEIRMLRAQRDALPVLEAEEPAGRRLGALELTASSESTSP